VNYGETNNRDRTARFFAARDFRLGALRVLQ